MTAIIDVEGIDEQYAAILTAAGVATVRALLEKAGSRAGREALAKATGIDAARILVWVNRADLMRIKGVGSEFSDLLEAAGVDSVSDLAQRRADNLHAKIVEINEAKKLVRRTPSAGQVLQWVNEAMTLHPVVEFASSVSVGASSYRSWISESPTARKTEESAVRNATPERLDEMDRVANRRGLELMEKVRKGEATWEDFKEMEDLARDEHVSEVVRRILAE